MRAILVVGFLWCLQAHGQCGYVFFNEGDRGELRHCNENGWLRGEGPTLKGKKHGEWTYYNQDGSLDESVTYSHNRRVGSWWSKSNVADSCYTDLSMDYVGSESCYKKGRLVTKTIFSNDKKGRSVKTIEQYNRFGKMTVATKYNHRGKAVETLH